MMDEQELRDYFAAKAMHAELVTAGAADEPAFALAVAAEANGRDVVDQMAANAYEMADAMLCARVLLAPLGVINNEGEFYMNITLGHVYRDVLTGIEGVATSVTAYVTGCDRVCLQPPPRDGKPGEVVFADVVTCEFVSSSRAREVVDRNMGNSAQQASGGPRRDPPPR